MTHKIVLTKEQKEELDYALSTTIGSKQYEDILVNFIRKHINAGFALSTCRCKSKLTKAKKVIKQRYDDIVVMQEGQAACIVCDSIFTKKTHNHKVCSNECREINK